MTMHALLRRARALLSLAAVTAVALGPMGLYYVSSRSEDAPAARFPSAIALVAHQGGQLRELGLLVHSPTPGIARFPADTSLSMPRAGTLRAVTAYDIVGAEPMADALANTLGMSVPFFIEGEATTIRGIFEGEVQTDLGDHIFEARELWESGLRRSFRAPGAYAITGITRAYVADARAVRLALRSKGKPTMRKPTPKPTLDISTFDVEVLRKAGANGAGTAAAELLRRKGFKVSRIANSDVDRQPSLTYVYYVKEKEMAEAVVKALGFKGVKAEALPRGFSTRADVVVLAGRDALAER